MSQMQKIGFNFLLGVSGGVLKGLSLALAHYNVLLGFITGTCGAIVVIFSAINSINAWRDRRETRRLAAEAKAAKSTEP